MEDKIYHTMIVRKMEINMRMMVIMLELIVNFKQSKISIFLHFWLKREPVCNGVSGTSQRDLYYLTKVRLEPNSVFRGHLFLTKTSIGLRLKPAHAVDLSSVSFRSWLHRIANVYSTIIKNIRSFLCKNMYRKYRGLPKHTAP